jgi:hypothetical protein
VLPQNDDHDVRRAVVGDDAVRYTRPPWDVARRVPRVFFESLSDTKVVNVFARYPNPPKEPDPFGVPAGQEKLP